MTENEKLDLILNRLEKLDNLESRFDHLEGRFDELENRFDSLENEVTGIKLILENEIRPNIMIVAEGHLDLYRKLDDVTRIENEKEMISIRVNILESEIRRVKEHIGCIA